MDGVDAVLFDLDDTLCVHDQDWNELLGTAFDVAGVDPLFTAADTAAVDTASLPTAESDREFFRNRFEAAATAVGHDPDPADLEAVANAYAEGYDPTAVSFRPGAETALEAARDRHDVGLVTNGAEATQTAKLEALGIRDAFDVEVYCDPAAGIEPKPDPVPLERALEGLGAAPGDTLFVGDDHAADVCGASDVGMRSAWVPVSDPDIVPEPTPTHVLDSMAAVPGLLGQ